MFWLDFLARVVRESIATLGTTPVGIISQITSVFVRLETELGQCVILAVRPRIGFRGLRVLSIEDKRMVKTLGGPSHVA